MIILLIILALIAVFLLVLTIRTLLIKPKRQLSKAKVLNYQLDKNAIATHLSQAIQIPTITPTLPDVAYPRSTFLDFHKYLQTTFPNVFKLAKTETVAELSYIVTVEGCDLSLLPVAFIAHMDVVPAPVEGWDLAPFGGEIKDGYINGRGAQDMKSQLIASLEGLEYLLSHGFEVKRTIMYCFGHDEELTGKYGANAITQLLLDRGTKLHCAIDEGGVITEGKILGINGKLALIGTTEKGYIDVELRVNKDGGHASSPSKKTAVAMLCQAVVKLNNKPMKSSFSKPVKELFMELRPYMNFPFKLMFANFDILSPLLRKVLGLIPLTNSLIRTTFAPTELKGAPAPNVLPRVATATINCRVNIGETAMDTLAYIQKVVGDGVEVKAISTMFEPSPVSNIDTLAYQTLVTSITEVFDGYIPAPYPFIAASDAKYYYRITDNVYRFTPFLMTEDDRKRVHAVNERISVDSLAEGVKFYVRLIENFNSTN